MDVNSRLDQALLGITDDIETGDYESYFTEMSELEGDQGWDEFGVSEGGGGFASSTFTPVQEDESTATRRRAWTKNVQTQASNLSKIQAAEKTLGGMSASDQMAIQNNSNAVQTLIEHTINDRLGPDLLLGLERALSSWMSGATLFFISGIALLQMGATGFPFVCGLVACLGSMAWIAYCFWQFWMRCGRLHRGERIPYNDNRTQTGFYVFLVVFGQIANLAFGYSYGTGKRVILVFVNATAADLANQAKPVSKVGAILIGSSISLVLLGISVGLVYWWNKRISQQEFENTY
eukprot:TRINITY_DN2056_c0_g1_i1.p1 TRINITY_DN2056_c0_g1~~TRINITY_DN2056_c0_g1_i1.p1  ORF type:complete len:317 (-),score=50.26 TRINITY_DN2056_c0_g1_i1:116-991(-)